jgi:2-keto-3-deoxy-L-rhamnonate aldolase RhmA
VNRLFRERLENGELLLGTIMALPSADVAEILSQVGFDWLFLDMEHAPYSLRDVQRICQAVGGRSACIVRIPDKSEIWVKRVIDIGPDGIIVPHIDTAEETERIIRWALYPPRGIRSAGIARAQGYGMKMDEAIRNSKAEMLVIPQIEHVDGVKNIEEIVRVEGVQAVFVGPYDLSGSLGMLGQVGDPKVQSKVKHVADVCRGANLKSGIFGLDAESVKRYVEFGYTLIALGADTLMLGEAAGKVVRSIR